MGTERRLAATDRFIFSGNGLFELRQRGHRHGRAERALQAGRGRTGIVCRFNSFTAMGRAGLGHSPTSFTFKCNSKPDHPDQSVESIQHRSSRKRGGRDHRPSFRMFFRQHFSPTNSPIYVEKKRIIQPLPSMIFRLQKMGSPFHRIVAVLSPVFKAFRTAGFFMRLAIPITCRSITISSRKSSRRTPLEIILWC